MTDSFFRSYFSPGHDCRKAICEQIQKTSQTLDICVFTISDNIITHAILDAHQRAVDIRILTDNDKINDRGSDIHWLAERGVPVKLDRTHHHMHHKFAVFERKIILTGSYNWTRSAAEYNQENIILTSHPLGVIQFFEEFERLWQAMEWY